MSGGTSCKCEESKKPIRERNWRITQYRCNHSAFNGYHRTSSAYSTIQCQRCGTPWRTKANYVVHLKMAESDGKEADLF